MLTTGVFWVLLSIAVAILADRYNRAGFAWFLFSLILSPLLGFAFVFASGPNTSSPPRAVLSRRDRIITHTAQAVIVVTALGFLVWPR